MATPENFTQHTIEAAIRGPVDAANLTGREWEVVIIGASSPDSLIQHGGREYIVSKNGRLYPTDVIEGSAAMFEGARVYDNHQTDKEYAERGNMRSPSREWLGTIVNVAWDAARRQLRGIMKLVDGGLMDKLKNASEAGLLGYVGLSIDTEVGEAQESVNGRVWPVVNMIQKLNSVDLVGEPAAGGQLIRAIASVQNRENVIMSDEVEETGAAQSVTLDGLAAQMGQLAELVGELAGRLPVAETAQEAEQDEEAAQDEGGEDRASEALAEVKRLRFEMAVDRAIEAAGLTGAFEELARAGIRVVGDIEPMIKKAKAASAAADPTGRASEAAAGRTGRVQVGMNEQDKAEIGLLQLLMGSTAFRGLEHNKTDYVSERFTESFHSWKNNGKEHLAPRRISEWAYELLGGNPLTDPRAMESVTTSSLASVMKNALNVMLANDYSQREEWWAPIVRVEEVDTIQQATLVRTYGLGELSVVAEGNAYTELAWADEEETASFVKAGNYVSVTLEAILRDNLSVIRSIPARLSNAWYNRLSDLVANVFTVNSAAGPVLSDTGALFNATAVTTPGGHANLLTTAFGTTTTAYIAARLAMRKQTDKTLGTGRRLGISPKFILVPYDLEIGAQAVINSEMVPGSGNNDPNPVFRESTVIGVPQWTDTNNWALVADPMQYPAIWNIFLRGMRVPSLFEASNEQSGAMFTNDTIRWKVRQMTYRFSDTYDCAPVSDFRPLHKSNVA